MKYAACWMIFVDVACLFYVRARITSCSLNIAILGHPSRLACER